MILAKICTSVIALYEQGSSNSSETQRDTRVVALIVDDSVSCMYRYICFYARTPVASNFSLLWSLSNCNITSTTDTLFGHPLLLTTATQVRKKSSRKKKKTNTAHMHKM